MYPAALAELEALFAAARAGSISKAARELGINQQTMSARIARAEKQLGITVFERSPYGVTPTENGHVLIDALPDLLAACHTFSGIAASLRSDDVPRHLTLAVSNTVAELYYPVWAAEFHRLHPAVKLSMVQANSREVRQLVADSAVDFGLVEGEAGRHELQEQVIGTDELVLAVPTEHPWAERAAVHNAVSIEELRTTPLVIREPGSGSRQVVEDALGNLAEPAGEFGSLSAQRAGMSALAAPTIIARGAIRDQVTLGRIVIVPTDTRFTRNLSAVMRRGSETSGDISEFIRIASPILSKHEQPQ
ncbi:LysR family transcriptional regulator [uncultured Corynebacterium sp.]|uniref:LysR family transcriptional regulator n=1 Tax=uncultured Corynebacterium sp. TaxID=159447 RepID=UPI00262FBC41|nr:LysR family transcriptional regulator [uncultured Corynebacterium sp.]